MTSSRPRSGCRSRWRSSSSVGRSAQCRSSSTSSTRPAAGRAEPRARPRPRTAGSAASRSPRSRRRARTGPRSGSSRPSSSRSRRGLGRERLAAPGQQVPQRLDERLERRQRLLVGAAVEHGGASLGVHLFGEAGGEAGLADAGGPDDEARSRSGRSAPAATRPAAASRHSSRPTNAPSVTRDVIAGRATVRTSPAERRLARPAAVGAA